MLCASLLLILQELLTSTVQSPVGGVEREDLAGIPGRPGSDYPTLSEVPKTSFSCLNRQEGFYPDPEARCQVFHVCGLSSGLRPQQSFLCPNGTLFNVQVKTCDWWNNVECSSNPLEETQQQPFKSGGETHPSRYDTKLIREESQVSDKNVNDGLYDFPKPSTQNEVKINFHRSKHLLDAFNPKKNLKESSDENIFKTLNLNINDDTYSGSKSFAGEGSFSQDARTYKEVNIRPRNKYTHSVLSSSPKIPIISVTTYHDPTENSLVEFKTSSEPNKYTNPERENKEDSLLSPWKLLQTSEGSDSKFQLPNKEPVRNISMNNKLVNRTINNYEKVKQSVAKIKTSSEHSFAPIDVMYLENTKLLKARGNAPVQDISKNFGKESSMIKNQSPLRENDKTLSTYKIDQEVKDFATSARDISADEIGNGYRSTFGETAPIKKYIGSVRDNGLLSLLINESKHGLQEKPNHFTSGRHLNTYSNYNQDQNYTEGAENYETKNVNLPRESHPTTSFINAFAVNEDVNNFKTSNSHKHTSPSENFNGENNKLQNIRTHNRFDNGGPLNTEQEEAFSISKQNFTYEEHTELLPEYLNVLPDLSKNTSSVPNSYVNVPIFSSFPELYTSSVSGFYITELPQTTKQSVQNYMDNYENEVKNRTTRFDDGTGHKLLSTSEKPLETNTDLVSSETESIYSTPKLIPTTLDDEFKNRHHDSRLNSNSQVTEETLLQANTKVLPSENSQETSFENSAILGPAISFENSHIAWPIFPPRSIFYSPYPTLKHSNSQLDATEPLTFFPHPPRGYRVNPPSDKEMYENHTNHYQESSSQETAKSASSTQNFDLAQVLQQFLLNTPYKEEKSLSKNESSTISIQPTVEMYSESTTSSTTLEDTRAKLDSSYVTPLEINRRNNDSPTISTQRTAEPVPFSDENASKHFRKEFTNDNNMKSKVLNDHLKVDPTNLELSEKKTPSLLTSQTKFTPPSSAQSLKTTLEPPDVLKINGLQTYPKSSVEESFKDSEIVKSLSFDLDSPEDVEQLEAAQLKGLLKR